jgi:heptosyltransferase-1
VSVSQPKNLLIVLHGAIGDVVRALPLAVRIKKQWPETRLTWAVEPLASDMLHEHPAIDEVIIFRRSGGYKEFRAYCKRIKGKNFDLVLDLQRHFKSGMVSRATGAKTRLGFHTKNTKELNFINSTDRIDYQPSYFSKIHHYQKFGDWLGLVPEEKLDFGLKFSDAVIQNAEASLRTACLVSEAPLPERDRRVAVLIGSSWESRKWATASYIRLCELIVSELHALPILCGGPNDESLAGEITRRLPISEYASVVGRTSLRELAYILSNVKSAVGMDSGPMHIASAVMTPIVSLWGPTDPRKSAPYGSENYVIQSAIGCAPCWRSNCPGLQGLCLSAIPPEIVMHRLSEIHAIS